MPRKFCVMLPLVLLVLAITPFALADENSKEFVLNVKQPVAVPNTILAPGHYDLRFTDDTNFDSVELFNSNGSLVGTYPVIPVIRNEPGNAAVTVQATARGVSRIEDWFYPGETWGFQLLYPRRSQVMTANVRAESEAGK